MSNPSPSSPRTLSKQAVKTVFADFASKRQYLMDSLDQSWDSQVAAQKWFITLHMPTGLAAALQRIKAPGSDPRVIEVAAVASWAMFSQASEPWEGFLSKYAVFGGLEILHNCLEQHEDSMAVQWSVCGALLSYALAVPQMQERIKTLALDRIIAAFKKYPSISFKGEFKDLVKWFQVAPDQGTPPGPVERLPEAPWDSPDTHAGLSPTAPTAAPPPPATPPPVVTNTSAATIEEPPVPAMDIERSYPSTTKASGLPTSSPMRQYIPPIHTAPTPVLSPALAPVPTDSSPTDSDARRPDMDESDSGYSEPEGGADDDPSPQPKMGGDSSTIAKQGTQRRLVVLGIGACLSAYAMYSLAAVWSLSAPETPCTREDCIWIPIRTEENLPWNLY